MEILILFILLIVTVIPAAYFWHRHIKRKNMLESLQHKTFLVKIPLDQKDDVDQKTEIALFERLISSLAHSNKPVFFEVAVSFIGEEISFYAAVPDSMAASFVKQVLSLWSGAEVEQVEDYNVFNYYGEAIAAYTKQGENFALPIRTYTEVDSDTFLSILGGFSKVDEIGEGAAIQIAVKPAEKSYKKKVKGVLKELKKGSDFKEALGKRGFKPSEIRKMLSVKDESKEEKEEKHVDENAVKALEAKLSKPFFKVNFRIVASAPTADQAEDILNGIISGLAQFGAPLRNEFSVVRPKNPRDLIYKYSFRRFDGKRAMILNTEELSSVFHFPSSSVIFPKVKYLKAREAPPPDNLPKKGILVGKSVYRGAEREVRLLDEDRFRHFYIIGQTGTGKTKFMQNMIVQDIKNGKGVAVVDPHGDLIEDIASLVPEERFDDVILFDPGDYQRPIGVNMLEYDLSKPEQKTFIVDEMLNIFDKLYDLKATGGPIFEQYFRNALLLLLEDMPNETVTLMEVERIFTDSAYRRRKLERISNPTVQDFWVKMAEKAGGEAALANVVPYITSKLASFTANDFMRGIVGQENSAFNIRKVMDEGKILLVNLSKGRLGGLNANLLGLIFVGKILMGAFSRFDIPGELRRDFYLYIDEFQNFTTDSISQIFAEARKYKLVLTVAHQFIAQLDEKIRDSVFGNVGSIAAFRVSSQDAEFLANQFKPVFKEGDLINIANFNAYAKLLINNETNRPFNIKAMPPEKGNADNLANLKELSRLKYGKDRKLVEEEIYKRLRI